MILFVVFLSALGIIYFMYKLWNESKMHMLLFVTTLLCWGMSMSVVFQLNYDRYYAITRDLFHSITQLIDAQRQHEVLRVIEDARIKGLFGSENLKRLAQQMHDEVINSATH